MLIKNYTRSGDLQIIENVKDVTVKAACICYDPTVPTVGPWKEFFFEPVQDLSSDDAKGTTYVAQEICYAHDGPCKLFVTGHAYICNDDGKTLEKIVIGPEVV